MITLIVREVCFAMPQAEQCLVDLTLSMLSIFASSSGSEDELCLQF